MAGKLCSENRTTMFKPIRNLPANSKTTVKWLGYHNPSALLQLRWPFVRFSQTCMVFSQKKNLFCIIYFWDVPSLSARACRLGLVGNVARFSHGVAVSNIVAICCASRDGYSPDPSWRRSSGRPRTTWFDHISSNTQSVQYISNQLLADVPAGNVALANLYSILCSDASVEIISHPFTKKPVDILD